MNRERVYKVKQLTECNHVDCKQSKNIYLNGINFRED